jgi:hypothetical protein
VDSATLYIHRVAVAEALNSFVCSMSFLCFSFYGCIHCCAYCVYWTGTPFIYIIILRGGGHLATRAKYMCGFLT